MSRSRARRGQVEPVAALAAVVVVGAALALYAGVATDALPEREGNLADPTLQRVRSAVSHHGVVVPRRLSAGLGAVPEGYAAHVAVVGRERAWHVGPPPDADADVAAVAATARTGPGAVRPVTLRVEVWAP